jgi:transcriptional regulator with XRE-family HTH domain
MARLSHGLSQEVVARAARTSRSQVGRVERGEAQRVSVWEIARLLAVVGLELSARAYPKGAPIRDCGQLALLARFRATLAPSARTRSEVPLPVSGDLRAWDLVLSIASGQIAVEAETRPRDVQPLLRRVELKLRDDPEITRVALLLADTRHNRTLLREHGPILRVDFPLPGQQFLGALHEGRIPESNGIVLL